MDNWIQIRVEYFLNCKISSEEQKQGKKCAKNTIKPCHEITANIRNNSMICVNYTEYQQGQLYN